MTRPATALLFLCLAVPAQAQTTKIVGIGASTCVRFNQETAEKPAWSGITLPGRRAS